MHKEFGIVRVSCAVPRVSIADPLGNATEILSIIESLPDSDVIVFPELCLSAYSCGRLFHQQVLLDECRDQLYRLAELTANTNQLIFVGLPLALDNALYNCVAAVNAGEIIGISPKQFIPTYNEFYEGRYFASADLDLPEFITLGDHEIPFGTDLIYSHWCGELEVTVYAEICEAMWMPVPPSSLAAIAGATIICNPSSSPETIGKAAYRRNLVVGQSGRCIAGYAYAGSGPTESTADVVFGGHSLIAQGGHLVSESGRVGDNQQTRRDAYTITADIDVERLLTERRTTTSYVDSLRYVHTDDYRRIPFDLTHDTQDLVSVVDAMPFVPDDNSQLAERCSDVFGIQTAGLAKRLECMGDNPQMVIGVSGGLDSTLALLIATRTCDVLDLPRTNITAVTMPGFGTTDHTLTNARQLMAHLGVTAKEIDIREAALLEYHELAELSDYQPFGSITLDNSHPGKRMSLDDFNSAIAAIPASLREDLVFENVQARRRTEILMNMGFVLGTGDMSEMWLGWCTYNADHQSMYNVNCSVPKTMVRFLVEYIAEAEFEGEVRNTLLSVATTEISPELLPPTESGQQSQSTEATVGPYELHDFFMFNLARYGFSPAKVLFLAERAEGWSRDYSREELIHWLSVNLKRAFSQQYKRDDVPNGPKVGSLSLSPRGDWRMPSDASVAAWLRSIKSTQGQDS